MTVSNSDDGERSSMTGPAASALAAPERRAVLAALLETSDSLGLDRLTRAVRRDVDEVDRPSGEGLRRGLYHTHLPALAAANLVVRPTPDRVALTDHPLLEADTICPATLRDDDRQWQAVADLLTQPRRLHVVDCLAERPAWHLEDLAATVGQRLPADHLQTVPGEDICGLLHHVDLPRLAESDLLRYDAASGMVKRGVLPDRDMLGRPPTGPTAVTDGGTAV
ncbi:hypothetical protein ACKVMT_15800 [Halobacteriales archaeon Cl-PHB]